MEREVKFLDWGEIDYKDAWDKQSKLHAEVVRLKRSDKEKAIPGFFICCEHFPVFTLGKSGSEDHLLKSSEELEELGIDFYKINRGGDITHHGPGQLVGYPILELEHWYRDVHKYVRNLEEIIIRTLQDFGIKGSRIEGYTGVWLKENGEERKICAIGVHLSRWVSMHGFALNVCNDLGLFQHIIPCGIQEENKKVTSISKELGREVSVDEVKSKLQHNFESVFECRLN